MPLNMAAKYGVKLDLEYKNNRVTTCVSVCAPHSEGLEK